MKIKRGDEVLVIKGKDRGKKGKVRKAFPKEGRIIVEGVNRVKRHIRRVAELRQTGIVEREAPIHVSKVKLICPKCGKPTRVGYKLLEDGKVRVCKKCGEEIE